MGLVYCIVIAFSISFVTKCYFVLQEKALKQLDKVTDFISRYMANNTEDASIMSGVGPTLLRGLGNILLISSQDASFGSVQKAWYIDREKVLHVREVCMYHCFD